MDDKFYRHRARVLRELATEADPFIKKGCCVLRTITTIWPQRTLSVMKRQWSRSYIPLSIAATAI